MKFVKKEPVKVVKKETVKIVKKEPVAIIRKEPVEPEEMAQDIFGFAFLNFIPFWLKDNCHSFLLKYEQPAIDIVFCLRMLLHALKCRKFATDHQG